MIEKQEHDGNEELDCVDITIYDTFAGALAEPGAPPGDRTKTAIGLVLTHRDSGKKICLRFPTEDDFIRVLAPMVEAARDVWPKGPGAKRAKTIEEMGERAPVTKCKATAGLKDAITIHGSEVESIVARDPDTVRVALMTGPDETKPSLLSVVAQREKDRPLNIVFPSEVLASIFAGSFCDAMDRLWAPEVREPRPEQRVLSRAHARRKRRGR